MKRFLIHACCVLALGLGAAAAAEEAGHSTARGEEAHASEGHGTHGNFWKVANFLLLAGGLGYLLAKKGGPFFRSRTDEIRRGLDEAAKLKADADARYAEMERRLARLDAEIAELRSSSQAEAAAEAERIREQTRNDLEKVRLQGEREIEAASKVARQELRAYSAELAIQLAEQRIRERMNPDTQDALVKTMISGLETTRSERQDDPLQVAKK